MALDLVGLRRRWAKNEAGPDHQLGGKGFRPGAYMVHVRLGGGFH